MANKKVAASSEISRRDFVKSAAAAGALAAPYFVPASVFGATAPSNRINVGCIGIGNQGSPNLLRFLKQKDCQVIAVCDVNCGSHGYKEPDDFYGREPAKKEVEQYYAKKKNVGQKTGCDAYNDFRGFLRRKDVVPVIVAPPDLWQEPMSIAAAEA